MKRKYDNNRVACSSENRPSGQDWCVVNIPMTEAEQVLLHSGTCGVGDSSVCSQSTTSVKIIKCEVCSTMNARERRRRCGTTLSLLVALAFFATFVAEVSPSSTIPQRRQPNDECNLYLAPSTIPGAGLGMFAGSRPFKKGERLAPPDIMIPAYDLEWNNGYQHLRFLWDEYTWSTCKFTVISCQVDFYSCLDRTLAPGVMALPMLVVLGTHPWISRNGVSLL
jgi:hypothetical protein